ncbi:glycosyltransferase [Chromohalobacter canadensis]|uniref:Glycosyl transferase family 1 domain-containing protein n=1 Tax=Chromohalobacter canadensis TaxID=141389 RepID=A0ABZ0YA57_9GAMM|nr:glycosyltransferase [Chromohalobacter canadensis]MCK0770247.1 hypothetical protein [Chromohalobacter canadensis]WQH08924.1 hypothetical protein SR908_15870 [Chromohalobacter canadensis]
MMRPTGGTALQKGNAALREGSPQDAIQHYLQAMSRHEGDISPFVSMLEGNLELARQHYRQRRREARHRGSPQRVAVCGWELAHNPAGRVLTLVDIYRRAGAKVEIIGSIFPRWGREPWPPMRGMATPCHTLLVEDEANFISHALQLVAKHPYDLVHLSKPRFPNLVFGLLYELVWGAKVVWDIDDEELGFVQATDSLSLQQALDGRGRLPPLEKLHNTFWTRLAVGQTSRFAAVTVSNPALQARYGGEIIPHVRDETRFVPSKARRAIARRRWGVPEHDKVVLFFGTPRKHKGLLATARAIASLGRDDLWFVIVGDFPDASLKEELLSIDGVQYRFIGGQPYQSIPDIVALGDYTVLLQESSSLVAQYQLPAKLVDALAMGLVVFAQVTPSTQWLADRGAIVPVTADTLGSILASNIEGSGCNAGQDVENRGFFEKELSLNKGVDVIVPVARFAESGASNTSWKGQLTNLYSGDIAGFLT